MLKTRATVARTMHLQQNPAASINNHKCWLFHNLLARDQRGSSHGHKQAIRKMLQRRFIVLFSLTENERTRKTKMQQSQDCYGCCLLQIEKQMHNTRQD